MWITYSLWELQRKESKGSTKGWIQAEQWGDSWSFQSKRMLYKQKTPNQLMRDFLLASSLLTLHCMCLSFMRWIMKMYTGELRALGQRWLTEDVTQKVAVQRYQPACCIPGTGTRGKRRWGKLVFAPAKLYIGLQWTSNTRAALTSWSPNRHKSSVSGKVAQLFPTL